MAITFGGLATGLDTNAIISELMRIERSPIKRLENDQSYFKSRLDVFSKLDGKLQEFFAKAEAIDTSAELNSPSVKTSTEDYLSATASGIADVGSYQVTVVDLAQQQKDVSQGYADKTSATFGTGSLDLTVAGVSTSITIDSTNNSLEGIAEAINNSDLGVQATIINDGTATPYRLILTGESVSDSFSLDSSGLSGGTDTNPTMTNTQVAQQAHIVVDGIDVYSDSNSVDSSLPGLSLELFKADQNVSTTVNVSVDKDATKEKIQGLVDAYNGVINYIAEQKSADWGNDSAFRSIKRHLQDILVSRQSGSGAFSSLSQIGFETQRDGTISVNSTALSDALTDIYEGVVSLFSGTSDSDGISAEFATYLEQMTDTATGLYAGRKESTESNLRRIDQRILSLEARMEQKEETLRARFTAMESLISGMNSQSTFLSQQMNILSNMMNKG
ncbi:flagellar filament capping protein FliD [Desulfopila inferna]|uniref:flagellar filament capping protein FliD n=1 Tax=Desulfopila inferna TaxID=468528 RepID=UPI001965417E|nr:flagellar filament capping protein FliD [Desulfopila inferna]MBM9603008.1 flagellar filament capping protein FliD [Desulfopila inferna]